MLANIKVLYFNKQPMEVDLLVYCSSRLGELL